MWNAKIVFLEDTGTSNDTANINVEYLEDTGKSFIKGYNLHASNFPDSQSILDFIESEVKTLERFNSVKESIKPLLNVEYTLDESAKLVPVKK